MAETIVSLYDIAENDRGELLLAIPDQHVEAEDARFSFNGPDLILHYDTARTLRLTEVPVTVRPKMKSIRQILVVESGEGVVYPAELAAAVPVGLGDESLIAEFTIEELTPPIDDEAKPLIAISFALTHRDVKTAQFAFDGDDLLLRFPNGGGARLPGVQIEMRVRLLALGHAMVTEGGLVRAYDARNIEPPPPRRVGRLRH